MSSVDSNDNIARFVRFKGDIRITLKMLEEGTISDINIRCSSWCDGTALMYQARWGTVESMESLLAHKPPALPNLKNSSYGSTALHLAIRYSDDPAKVRLLLDYGADKTIRNDVGQTALEYAREWDRTECIKVLKSYIPKLRG
jgi:ankyrin repeat protein